MDNAAIAMNGFPKERRLSIGDEEPKERRVSGRRLSDRMQNLESWAVDHQERHEARIRMEIEAFMASEAFTGVVKRLLNHADIREAMITAKNQMVGEIVTAIFSNRLLWLFCAMVILLLMGYDASSIKELIRMLVR
jgi:hypothetical protein